MIVRLHYIINVNKLGYRHIHRISRASMGCIWYEPDVESCQCQILYRNTSFLFKIRAKHPVSVLLEAVGEELFPKTPALHLSLVWKPRARLSVQSGYLTSAKGLETVQWARSSLLSTVFDTCMANAPSRNCRSLLNISGKIGSDFVNIPLELVSQDEKSRPLKQELAVVEKKLAPLQKKKDTLDKHGQTHATRMAWMGLAGLLLQWGVLFRLTFYDLSWDVVEPISYFLTFGTAILGYIFYLFTRKDYTFMTLGDVTISKAQDRLYKKHNFPSVEYERLYSQRLILNQKLQALEVKHDQLDKLF